MTRSEAIRLVNSRIGNRVLTNENTNFSNINTAAKGVWWIHIPLKRFNHDLHLLLKDAAILIWLKIPANSFPDPKQIFKYREDKGVIDLELSCKLENYLIDIKPKGTGYKFKEHIENEFPITEAGNVTRR